jgi:hypothetical protein
MQNKQQWNHPQLTCWLNIKLDLLASQRLNFDLHAKILKVSTGMICQPTRSQTINKASHFGVNHLIMYVHGTIRDKTLAMRIAAGGLQRKKKGCIAC